MLTQASEAEVSKLKAYNTCLTHLFFNCGLNLCLLSHITHVDTQTQASEAEVSKLKEQLESQKKELEAAAAASLEKAEEAFTKQLAEMQTLLADYQTQVRGCGCVCCVLCIVCCGGEGGLR